MSSVTHLEALDLADKFRAAAGTAQYSVLLTVIALTAEYGSHRVLG